MPKASVTIAASAPGFGAHGSLSSTTVTTGVYGTYDVSYLAPDAAGAVLLTATASGSPSSSSTAFATTPGNVAAGGAGSGTPNLTLSAAGGTGGAGVVQYSADPVSAPGPKGTTGYFDAGLSAGSTFQSVTIHDCGLAGPERAFWWNGSAWAAVSPQSFASGCLTIGPLLASGTSTTIAQMGGTPFSVSTAPSQLAAGDVLTFRPVPVAPTGTLSPDQTVTVSVYAQDASRAPVPDATVYLSLAGGGSARVGATALSSTPQAFTTGSGGVVSLTYTAPATLPDGGVATIQAAGDDHGAPGDHRLGHLHLRVAAERRRHANHADHAEHVGRAAPHLGR